MSPSFLDVVETVAADRVALSDATESITYGQLRTQARLVAGVLDQRTLASGLVIVKARSTVRFVTTLLGVMYAGRTPVPVDPELPAAAVEFIRAKADAVEVLEPMNETALDGATAVDRRNPEAPALIMFTSGTSGFPKGVIVSHANLLASCQAMAAYLGYHAHPSAGVVLPVHYSYALLSQVCCQLTVGGHVHLFADMRNPLKVSRVMNDLRLETFCGVPSTFHALRAFHALSPIVMPHVRVLCSAGAAMDVAELQHVKAIFPAAMFFNNYGMTEAAPRIAYCREDDARFSEGTCGRPMAGVDVKIVDPDTHVELPDQTRGVLVVRGPNVTAGYLNEPEQTRRAYTSDGYLISGDLAYRDRGYLFICGRLDDTFNSGGEKMVPLEIERVLNTADGVEMSALAGIPDKNRGMIAVAFIKPIHNGLTRAALVRHLRRELPTSKIPQHFIEVRAFPMTSNGKLQRRRLSPDDREFVVREIR
jgi:acyl-CoA synthetase (AMP-forming)/AMP-acid ligase II